MVNESNYKKPSSRVIRLDSKILNALEIKADKEEITLREFLENIILEYLGDGFEKEVLEESPSEEIEDNFDVGEDLDNLTNKYNLFGGFHG